MVQFVAGSALKSSWKIFPAAGLPAVTEEVGVSAGFFAVDVARLAGVRVTGVMVSVTSGVPEGITSTGVETSPVAVSVGPRIPASARRGRQMRLVKKAVTTSRQHRAARTIKTITARTRDRRCTGALGGADLLPAGPG